MCGIAGYVVLNSDSRSGEKLASMARSIAHRGPDDEGFVLINTRTGEHVDLIGKQSSAHFAGQRPLILETEFSHNVGFAHRRYSIIDLSPNGHQPMWSACQSACITFNGEIYNYIELREELGRLGHSFHTGSDTEVFLQGYLAWGQDVFQKLNGFFAVAIYDARRKAVLLARDRLGKAHLYLARSKQSIFWASEIKALIAAGCVDRTNIDSSAVADFVYFGRRDRTGTFWPEAEDFPVGHYCWVDANGKWAPVRYWGLPSIRWDLSDISRSDAALGLRDILSNALAIRMRADVPIGFELSGGMDSSALVGLAAGHLRRNLTSYTIRFNEEHSNEEPFARSVAARYPDMIDYRVIQQPENNFWDAADSFVWLQEEPFHAPNLQTNQYLRRMIKSDGAHVVITGSAGDEMLAGYPGDYLVPYLRYLLGKPDWRRFYKEISMNTEIPASRSLRTMIMREFLSEESSSRFAQYRSGESRLLKEVLLPEVRNARVRFPSKAAEKTFHGLTLANMTYRRMNYWLRSGPKSNYGIPIEARSPFLDYRVVEFCCQLPPEYLISDGWHKHVLRLAVQDYLPEEVVWRQNKMGFPFPYREWLAASRTVVEKNAQGLDCPYVNVKSLLDCYGKFVKVAPIKLWRLISVMLWWRRVIEDREVVAS
jgi:asparagine synthase (glutamine-hydrolysing)